MTAKIDGSAVSLAAAHPATGVRDLSLATMQKFADEFLASKTGPGWQKLPSGLIIQWGFNAPGGAGDATINFPIAFPTGTTVTATPTASAPATTSLLVCQVTAATLTAFTVTRRYCSAGSVGADGSAFSWIAIGY